MRDLDGQKSDVAEPLRGIIDSVKPLLNELIFKWQTFPSLWDAQRCPLDQLTALAYSVGIQLDTTKSELLQRSEVLSATQLFLHKGDDAGYVALAAFEDLLVEVTGLWAEDCDPGALLRTAGPTTWVPHLDDVPADVLPLDASYTDPYAIWPYRLYAVDVCRSHSLRLVFYPTANPNQDFDPDVATRLAARLLRYKPIHVTIDRVTFDGLRGSSSEWVQAVVSDSSAVGEFVGAATGDQVASSSEWVQAVVGIPTP